MFLFSDFNGSSRYARGRLSDSKRGEYTVYVMWEDYGELSLLREVQN